jgi:hypothetical protein
LIPKQQLIISSPLDKRHLMDGNTTPYRLTIGLDRILGRYKKPPVSMDTRRLEITTRDSRGHALNLAGLEALGAHANAHVLSVDSSANRLEVRAEGALIANM